MAVTLSMALFPYLRSVGCWLWLVLATCCHTSRRRRDSYMATPRSQVRTLGNGVDDHNDDDLWEDIPLSACRRLGIHSSIHPSFHPSILPSNDVDFTFACIMMLPTTMYAMSVDG
jgi:hypothetical protein